MKQKRFYNNTKNSSNESKKNTIPNNRIKDSEIKLRVTKEQKKALQDKAKKLDMTLTSYILAPHTKDTVELLQLIPDAVEIWNALNGLYRLMKAANNTKPSAENNILNECIQKNNRLLEGGICSETTK